MSIESWTAAGAIGQILGALATFAVAVIAVFQHGIWHLVRHPILVPSCRAQRPQCQLVDMQAKPGVWQTVCYCRIQVTNTGKAAAEQLEIYLKRLERQEAGGYVPINDFLPMNLVWTHIGSPILPALSPGFPRYCDLGFAAPVDGRRILFGDERLVFQLTTEFPYARCNQHLLPGRYKLHLLIAQEMFDQSSELSRSIYLEDGLTMRMNCSTTTCALSLARPGAAGTRERTQLRWRPSSCRPVRCTAAWFESSCDASCAAARAPTSAPYSSSRANRSVLVPEFV